MGAAYDKPVREAIFGRNNEFLGDLAAWDRDHSVDNSDQIDRLRSNLRRARAMELTARQSEMMHLYYDLGLSMTQIAGELGVTKSTVSRTLSRGRKRLKRYLQYSL